MFGWYSIVPNNFWVGKKTLKVNWNQLKVNWNQLKVNWHQLKINIYPKKIVEGGAQKKLSIIQ